MENKNNANLDFSEVFSMEDYKTYIDHKNTRPEIVNITSITNVEDVLTLAYKQWSKQSRKLLDELVITAIEKFLLKMKAAGKFAPVSNSDEVSTRFINAWNRIAIAETSDVEAELIKFVANRLGKLVYSSVYSISNVDVDNYKSLCKYMSEGNFQWYEVDINDECRKTGKDLNLQFKGWNCMHGSFVNNNFVLSEIIEKRPAVAHTTVSFKTGNLLIADWFRIEEFTNVVDESKDPDSIGSEAGREQQTQQYAKEFNFISVSVGNTCPTIFENQGKLVFGYINEEFGQYNPSRKKTKDSFTEVGSVCTDYWAATIIEEENLIDIIATKIGQDNAKSLVKEYLTKNDVKRIRVEPGQYHIYFHGNSHGFHESFATDSFDLSRVCDPYFVVSNEALELKDPKEAIKSAPVKKHKP